MKRVLIVAGEASADMHAANLVRAISKNTKEKLEFSGLGGDALISTGVFTPEFYNRDFAVSGLWELAGHLRKIHSALNHFKSMASLGSYDLAVLLDYPDFNIPLAKYLTKKRIPVVYYISPQVWVWRAARANKLAKNSKEVLTIFPFEKDFYKQRGIDVKYVGHPIIDQIAQYLKSRDLGKLKKEFNVKANQKIIAVLPGSRHGEIKYILPVLEESCVLLKQKMGDGVRFILPVAPTLKEEDIYSVLKPGNNGLFEIVKNKTYDVYSIADYAVLASGTATVEVALFNLPMTIVYKVSCVSAFLFKNIIRYKKPIGMVNLLLNEDVAKEFFQENATAEKITNDIISNLANEKKYSDVKNKLKKLEQILSTGESPSVVAAKQVLKFI